MFLRSKTRKKDGKLHRYWSVVENRRLASRRVVQRQVLYLGEINDQQEAAWCRAIEVFDHGTTQAKSIALFPEDRHPPIMDCETVQVRLHKMQLKHPRQWGACWLAMTLWNQLKLDDFWSERLTCSRKGTSWLNVLKLLTAYRLIDPGSEWRLHRQWFEDNAMGDLLAEDFSIAASNTLYRSLDKLLPHKTEMFTFLRGRWEDLFKSKFDILLYDLTSTYFECDPPGAGIRRFGYSRDKRSDCVQVVIALIVTPEGLPLAYEVLAGNTLDKTTLKDFLGKIESQYGKADRVWVMDRGIPTEDVLKEMRDAEPRVQYLVGTSRGKLTSLEQTFLSKPWQKARESVRVKLAESDGETYILALSNGRVRKEQSMRKRKLKKLWARLKELRTQSLSRDQLLIKLGAAKKDAGRAFGLVTIGLPNKDQAVTPETFTFKLDKDKLRVARRREGTYLLRTNLTNEDPSTLWQYYIQLTEVEQAFKELKSDLSIRPIHHQKDNRIEAHIFVSFMAYCLQVTLKQRLRALAPGLTPRAVLEKFASMMMIDVHLPTTDNRNIILSRYTEPNKDQQLLIQQMRLELPTQPPPKIIPSDNL
ncbi:MAG: IS1634 family transposase [Deltaproteobacteria bacterium]|nr:IS1634 family transposase [Deltaproteobacteria bacterium]